MLRDSRFLRAEKRPFGMTKILGIGMSRCSDVHHFAAPCICANRIEHLSFRRVKEGGICCAPARFLGVCGSWEKEKQIPPG